MLHLRNNTGFKHVFVPKIQDFFAYLEENLFLIWVNEGETWNLLYRNTGPDLVATQKQEGSMKKTNNEIQWPLVRFDCYVFAPSWLPKDLLLMKIQNIFEYKLI